MQNLEKFVFVFLTLKAVIVRLWGLSTSASAWCGVEKSGLRSRGCWAPGGSVWGQGPSWTWCVPASSLRHTRLENSECVVILHIAEEPISAPCPSRLCLSGQRLCRNAGGVGSSPGLGRSGEGKGNPPQYSCLGNPMDRGAWWATVRGVTQSQTQSSH